MMSKKKRKREKQEEESKAAYLARLMKVCDAWVNFRPKVPLSYAVAARKAAREARGLS